MKEQLPNISLLQSEQSELNSCLDSSKDNDGQSPCYDELTKAKDSRYWFLSRNHFILLNDMNLSKSKNQGNLA